MIDERKGPRGAITINDIRYESRYGQVEEVGLMMAVAENYLTPAQRASTTLMSCNSKLGSQFAVYVVSDDKAMADAVLAGLHDGFSRLNGGHNGIGIFTPDFSGLPGAQKLLGEKGADWTGDTAARQRQLTTRAVLTKEWQKQARPWWKVRDDWDQLTAREAAAPDV